MIRFLQGYELDRNKWDNCVNCSKAGHVYGLSWYLDLVAPGWAGLVKGDYESVMPLTIKRKYGVSYIFQPVFAQQLGVISPELADEAVVDEFIKSIPRFIRFIDFNLNFTNKVNETIPHTSKNVNYELPLELEYINLKNNYSKNTRRNIQKAIKFVKIRENIAPDLLIEMKRRNSVRKRKTAYYEWMHSFVNKVMIMGLGEVIGAESDGEICAVAFFIKFKKRIYYMIPVSDNAGKESSAMFAILDYQVRKYSGREHILDFEGSSIPGIAQFFKGFGAKPTEYLRIKMNSLPFFMKFIRK